MVTKTVIFRPYTTLRNGKVIWARDYGLKAFPISIETDKEKKNPPDPRK